MRTDPSPSADTQLEARLRNTRGDLWRLLE